ncbi:MAG: hypothetical protein IT371_25965 [Deltaproteobacteria bacterium]|nr:hypothetical protein [Deltaproteobacteria bacterium]
MPRFLPATLRALRTCTVVASCLLVSACLRGGFDPPRPTGDGAGNGTADAAHGLDGPVGDRGLLDGLPATDLRRDGPKTDGRRVDALASDARPSDAPRPADARPRDARPPDGPRKDARLGDSRPPQPKVDGFVIPVSCGNKKCEPLSGETAANCLLDCHCGNITTEYWLGEDCDGTDQECAWQSGEMCDQFCKCVQRPPPPP